MAQFTRANGPMEVNVDESPLFGRSSTLDNTPADVNTIGQYDAEKDANDKARTERHNLASSSN